MTRTERHRFRSSLLEAARLIAGFLIMAALVLLLPFIFAIR